MSIDPLAPKIAARFFSSLKRAFDVVNVKMAEGGEREFEVVKRYGEFVVHVAVGGRGYSIVHAPSGQTVRTSVTSRKMADGMTKYLSQSEGRSLYLKAARGDLPAKITLEDTLTNFRPTPGPPKRGGGKVAVTSYPFEAAADGNHVTRTFRSVEAALRAAIEFRKDHPGDSDYDWLRITRRASDKSAPEHLVTLRGTGDGWRILASALTDAPEHLVSELLDRDDEE